MLKMIYVSPKFAKPFSRYEALKFKFPRKKQNYPFLQCQREKMESNGIFDVIVDNFIMKKEAICHISNIMDSEVMKLCTKSVRHTEDISG